MDSKTIDLLEALKDVSDQQQSTNSSLLGVVGRDLGNLPSKAATSLFGGLNALANAGAPKEEREAGAWKVPNLFDDSTVTGESSGSEKFAHIILGGVAPEIAALAVPYIGVSKLATGLGAGAKVASLFADVGAGVVAGAPEGVEGMGKEAATFVGLNLGLGALGRAFKSVKGESKIANLQKFTETPVLPTEVIPPTRDRRALRLPAQSADVSESVIDIPARVASPVDDLSTSVQFENSPNKYVNSIIKLVQTLKPENPTVLLDQFIQEASLEGKSTKIYTEAKDLIQKNNPNLFGDFKFVQPIERTDLRFTPNAQKPIEIAPELIPRPLMMQRGKLPTPREEIIPIPQISNPKQLTLADLQIKQNPSKGKIPALPEYRRTEGGSFTSGDLAFPLLLSGLGGIAGGAIGGKLTGTEEGMGLGAAAGILAPWALPLLMKHPFEDSALFKSARERGAIGGPAFRLPNGYVIKGKVGQAHWDLVDQVPNSIPPSQIERGFVNDKGEFLTPHEANSEALLEGQIDKRTFKENARTQKLGLTTEDLKKEGTYDTPFSSEGGSVGGGGMQRGIGNIPTKSFIDTHGNLIIGEGNHDEIAQSFLGNDIKRGIRPTEILKDKGFARLVKEGNRLYVDINYPLNFTQTKKLKQVAEDFNLNLEISKPFKLKLAEQTGQSNLTALIEKNIADAKMMQPNDPEGFLRKMADAAKTKGNQAAVDNFEAAIANLQSQKKILNEKTVPLDQSDYEMFNGVSDSSLKNGRYIPELFVEKNNRGGLEGPKELASIVKEADKNNTDLFLQAYPYETSQGVEFDRKQAELIRAYKIFGFEEHSRGWMHRPANSVSDQASKLFKLNTKNDAGSTSVSTLLPLAGAVAGGIAGYNEGQNEGAVAGAIGGLTLGILGGRMLDRLHVSTPSSTVPQVAKTVKTTVKAGFDNALNTPAKDLGGQDVYGRGGILPKAFRAMENLFNLGLPSELHSIITRARGFASEIVDQATRGIKEAIGYNPPEDIQKLTNRFLNGELVEDQLPRGAYSAESYKKLVSTEREKLGLFTNAKGERFYATPEAKAEYLTTQEKAYLESVPEDWKDFANLQIGLRRNMNTFQQIIANALPEGPLKEKIEDSIGRYAPRLYRIFTDKKYAVTDDQIAVASKEFGLTKSQREIDTAINVHQAKEQTEFSKLVTELSQSNSLSNQERLARLSKFQPIQVGGKSYMAAPDIVESMKKYGNEDYLFNEVRSYLADLKGNREVYGGSKGIDSSLFMQRENLGPAWRDMLGEYTDPTERMAMGLQKMYAPAQAAKLIDIVGGMEIDGLPISLSGDKWAALNTQLKGIGDVANLQKLNAYKKLPEDIKFGEYKGLYVHRFLADYFSNDSRLWETALGQHMAEFNRFFKTTHVPFNPISQLRQIISMPIFALIGRANPASMMQAWSAKMGKNPELNAELIREGIWTADFIRGELHGGIEPIIEGRYDSEIVKGLKGAKEHILEAYRIPDMMVRGGTYIAAKNRIASKLGKALDDPEVIQQAVEWTDRYTMNYDNVSRAVRVARNIPFVNPFISFQAETLRILKNLAVDTARGDVERLAVLGGLIAVPELAMKAAEGSLKPDDRAQWDKMKSSLPPYMRDAFLLPIAKLQNGKFKYVSISPIIPQDNFQQAVKALGQNDMEAFWSINPFLSKDKSPLFNLISEAVTGESRQTGLKYRDTQEQLKSMVSEILPPIAPGSYEWNKLANVNVENLRSGKVEDWGDIALRYTTGLSSGVLKSDAVMRGAQSKLKQDIANLRSYYQRIAQSTSPEEIKKEAYEDYVEGVKLLIHDFSEKIQP